MTAAIVAKQRDRIHIATDAAIYRQGEGVVAFGSKVTTVPHWPGCITGAGNAAAGPLFAPALGRLFSTWDLMIDGWTNAIQEIQNLAGAFELSHATIIMAGISEKRGPESFTFQTTLTLPPGTTAEEAEASPYYQPPFALVKLPDHICTPVPPPAMSIAANFEGIATNDDPDVCVWSLRKVLEMQRQMPLPDGVGGIGGWVELTTVSAEGVTQRVLRSWPEDKIGGPLRPKPINWPRWHIENPKPKRGAALRVAK